jgi:predicted DNA-binding transcriptional regulator AlpA
MSQDERKIQQEIYFMRDVVKLTGIAKFTLRSWWEKGEFPKPALIGGLLCWRVKDINNWLDEKFNNV